MLPPTCRSGGGSSRRRRPRHHATRPTCRNGAQHSRVTRAGGEPGHLWSHISTLLTSHHTWTYGHTLLITYGHTLVRDSPGHMWSHTPTCLLTHLTPHPTPPLSRAQLERVMRPLQPGSPRTPREPPGGSSPQQQLQQRLAQVRPSSPPVFVQPGSRHPGGEWRPSRGSGGVGGHQALHCTAAACQPIATRPRHVHNHKRDPVGSLFIIITIVVIIIRRSGQKSAPSTFGRREQPVIIINLL